jgi:hypothetical protein
MTDQTDFDHLATARAAAGQLRGEAGLEWLQFVRDDDLVTLMQLATRSDLRDATSLGGEDRATFCAIITRVVDLLRREPAGIHVPHLRGLADGLELRAKMLGWRRGEA